MINVLAIDDEPLALLQLQKMIEKTPYFNLVASCSSAFEAMRVIDEQEVDALFTDINMPDLSGLDFVRTLTRIPIIVFTTAYSQYAIEGYKVNAIDYLLKPFGLPEFQRAAAKVKQQYDLLHREKAEEALAISADASGRDVNRLEGDILFVKVDYRIVRISISDIRYIESQSEYLKLYLKQGTPLMVLMSIKRMNELLPKELFVRIHRSYIVNMSCVIEIAKMRVKMDANISLPVGDLYKEEVMRFVNNRMVGK